MVVLETVGRIEGRQLDTGESPAPVDASIDEFPGSIPLAFYAFQVDEVLKGAVPEVIHLGWLDSFLAVSDEITAIEEGEKLLLFLRRETPQTAPGIDILPIHFSPVGMNSGVFDVSGESAVARAPDLIRLEAADEQTDSESASEVRIPLSDVRAIVLAP